MPAQHLITHDEVAAWLAGSVVTTVTYHRTTAFSARLIVEQGVSLARSRTGAYGQGFYSATAADDYHGDTTLVVAVRLLRPVVGHVDEVVRFLDDLMFELFGHARLLTPDVAVAIRRRLMRLGYDGLVVRDGGGDGVDYVVSLHAASVKVVAG